jgi:hypothetical protein
MKNRALLVVALGLLVVLFVGYLIFSFYRNSVYSAGITVELVPSGSKLTVNSVGTKAGVIKVKPGQVNVTATHAGFTPYTKTLNVTKGNNMYVGIVLASNSNTTARWYQDHTNDGKIAERISSKSFDQTSAQSVANVPFISKLPFLGPGLEFRIDYGQNGENDLGGNPAIYITAPTTEAQQDAITWIKNQGYDPAKLKIIYVTSTP